MLSLLPSEVVSFICSFSDANTFYSFTLTNSSYNQNQTLYQEYIIKNYSPELFGFHVWDHAVLKHRGFLPNKKKFPEKTSVFPAPKSGLVPEALRWKDLFYRINSKKYLNICGTERKFPVYFNETLLNIVQRVNERRDIDKLPSYLLFDPIGGYVLQVSDGLDGACCSYRCNEGLQMPSFEHHQMSSVLGSIINNENYLFDMLSVIGLKLNS
jgi:hypothetical protein